ncbi:4-hydroxy-tetrahydrodipicolinate synthase, chloroplastic [Dionaea muscipula]
MAFTTQVQWTYCNTGSNSTREAIHATEQSFIVGVHVALHINPYYGKTSSEGLISHFKSVLSMGPTIIYNVPSRTSHDISPSVIYSIASNRNIASIKECMGNDRIKQYTDNGIVAWSENDDECHDARWGHGATRGAESHWVEYCSSSARSGEASVLTTLCASSLDEEDCICNVGE